MDECRERFQPFELMAEYFGRSKGRYALQDIELTCLREPL